MKIFWFKIQIHLFQKAVLRDLEWKIFFTTQPWWAVFKISFVQLFSLEKLTNHFLKVKSNPDIWTQNFCHAWDNATLCMTYPDKQQKH